MEDEKSPERTALERAKMTPAERRFERCRKDYLALPDNDFKRTSLFILNSDIFWRGELKGKVSKNKNKQYVTYPIKDLGGLIAKLVKAHLERLNLNIDEIHQRQLILAMHSLRASRNLPAVAVQARDLPRKDDFLFQEAKNLGVANQAEIDRITKNGLIQDLKDKDMDALNELEKPLHLSLAKIFHTYASSAPTARLAEWVNEVLKVLGQNQIPDRTLREHITNEIIQK